MVAQVLRRQLLDHPLLMQVAVVARHTVVVVEHQELAVLEAVVMVVELLLPERMARLV
jgi:hypothetical protein